MTQTMRKTIYNPEQSADDVLGFFVQCADGRVGRVIAVTDGGFALVLCVDKAERPYHPHALEVLRKRPEATP